MLWQSVARTSSNLMLTSAHLVAAVLESLMESRDSFWYGGVADLATRIFRRPPVGHFNANGASFGFGSSKDPSGRNMVIIQSFAFETIFLHPGGQRPTLHVHMCVGKCCWQIVFDKCLWQMPSAIWEDKLSTALPPGRTRKLNLFLLLQGSSDGLLILFAVLFGKANTPG